MIGMNEIWALRPECMPRLPDEKELGAMATAPAAGPGGMVMAGLATGVVVIPIRGLLLPRGDERMRARGFEHTGYDEIREALSAALEERGTREIVLDVNSVGGLVEGLLDTAAAIFAARDRVRVRAVVSGKATSGAYYLASQADVIVSTADAQLGSIGVFSVVLDASKAFDEMGIKVYVLRSGALKGTILGEAVTEGRLAVEQHVVEEYAAQFVRAVARGRGMSVEAVGELATGAYWLADEAMGFGLIDEVGPRDPALDKRDGRSGRNGAVAAQRGESMTEQEIREQAVADAVSRRKALTEAFPGDVDFVDRMWTAGSGVDAAKIEHHSVLREKLTGAQAKIAELEASVSALTASGAAAAGEIAVLKSELEKRPPRVGAEPLDAGGAGDVVATDYMGLAASIRKEQKCSAAESFRLASKERPDLYKAYVGR